MIPLYNSYLVQRESFTSEMPDAKLGRNVSFRKYPRYFSSAFGRLFLSSVCNERAMGEKRRRVLASRGTVPFKRRSYRICYPFAPSLPLFKPPLPDVAASLPTIDSSTTIYRKVHRRCIAMRHTYAPRIPHPLQFARNRWGRRTGGRQRMSEDTEGKGDIARQADTNE